MKCTVAAVRCVITEKDGQIVLDPSQRSSDAEESNTQRADFVFVFDSVERKAVSCHCTGRYTPEEFEEAMVVAGSASEEVFQFYRNSLRKFAKIL